MPMSAYPHGYTLSPARPSGWGSVFAGVVTVIAVVAVSAMSGALVMAELVGSRPDAAPSPSTSAMSAIEIPSVRQAAAPAAMPAAQTKTRPAEDKRVAALPTPAPAPKPVAAPAPAPKPVVAAAPQPAPAAPTQAPTVAQAAPAAPAPTVAQAANAVPDSELTFSKGYAQRRAAQTAAEQSTPQPTAHAATDHQFGRPAVTQRKPTYARAQEQRRYAVRDSREAREYRDQWRDHDRYDYRRDRAMAYGDQYQGRRSNGSQGGLFGNLFGGGNLF